MLHKKREEKRKKREREVFEEMPSTL